MRRYLCVASAVVFCSVLLALFSTLARISADGRATASAGAQDSELRERISALSSSNPIERASAACCLGEMREGAVAAIPYLMHVLGDDAVITRLACGQRARCSDPPGPPQK